MALTEKEVRYVAELAHLQLTDQEVAEFRPQLDCILEYIDKLNELKLERAGPLAQILAEAPGDFAWREDVRRSAFTPEEAVANAPDSQAGLFKVPRVLEREKEDAAAKRML